MSLADLTTLRVGGPAADLVTASRTAELVAAVRGADRDGVPVLLLGGGSNTLVGDAGFDGRLVLVRTAGIEAVAGGDRGTPDARRVRVRVAAGESWTALVDTAVARGWSGLEALAGIPGSVGASPVQNVGAYGQEVADTVTAVQVLDRADGGVRT